MSIRLGGLSSLALGRLLLDQARQMLDDVGILHAMVRDTRDVDLMRAVAAAGEADIRLPCLARSIHHTANDRHRHRRGDVGHTFFQSLDGTDHVVLLTGAGGAGDDVDAAMAQVQRLQHLEADPHLFFRLGRERNADGIADARP